MQNTFTAFKPNHSVGYASCGFFLIHRKKRTIKRSPTYVIYSKNVDRGSVAWHNMCLYSSTSLRVHFSTIVVVCNDKPAISRNDHEIRTEPWITITNIEMNNPYFFELLKFRHILAGSSEENYSFIQNSTNWTLNDQMQPMKTKIRNRLFNWLFWSV